MHTTKDILNLLLAILSAFGTFRALSGLLPQARPLFWTFRSTGLKKVRLSKLSLGACACACFGFAIACTGAVFFTDTVSLTGFCIAAVGFAFALFSRSKDVRRARRERLTDWIS